MDSNISSRNLLSDNDTKPMQEMEVVYTWEMDFNRSLLGAATLLIPKKPTPAPSSSTMPLWAHNSWICLFAAMLAVAIGGNAIVIWIVTAHRRMRTVTNYFLVNLSFADLMMASLNCLFNFIYMLHSDWVFGVRYCQLSNFLANVTVAASVFTLTGISFDRYQAIVKPMRPRMSKTCSLIMIAAIWICGMLLAIPCLLYSTTKEYKSKGILKTACLLSWPDGLPDVSYMDFMYQVLFSVVTYAVPMLGMTFFYSAMGRVLWGSRSIGELTQRQADSIRSKRKVVKMFILVIVIFGICWLPYHTYFIYTHFNPSILYKKYVQHIYLGFYWLAMANAMVNPIIYYWMNAKFRAYFRTAILCRWCDALCRRKRPLPESPPDYHSQSGSRSRSGLEGLRGSRGNTPHGWPRLSSVPAPPLSLRPPSLASCPRCPYHANYDHRHRRSATPSTQSSLDYYDHNTEILSDESPQNKSDDFLEPNIVSVVNVVPSEVPAPSAPSDVVRQQAAGPELNQPSTSAVPDEILNMLGEAKKIDEALGEKIPNEISERWGKILVDGLGKEHKEAILGKMLVPENFLLARAPKLNPEVCAVLSDTIKNRDKRLEKVQNQLGSGIAGLVNLTKDLIKSDLDKLDIIKRISEVSQILLDLHYEETINRRKLIVPLLDKKFWTTIQGVKREVFLFGDKLGENIKNSKDIEKSGQQIKKPSIQPIFQRKAPPVPGNARLPPRQQNQKNTPAAGRWYNEAQPSTSARRMTTATQQRGRPPPPKPHDRRRR